ncbi:hypothetical protein TURU_018123 [Turdus rufiventris]|nr:hypothetical protein TURU_018123 [Turdus rufiventris]
MTHLQAGLSPETIEKARLELNENPDILHQDIQQVRDMIITRPDIGFLRTDDAFILRFLRARKFHQTEAFRLLAQYFQYRQLNLDMFKNFKADDPGIKRALTDGFPGVLENRDHCGRKILLLFAANWDQNAFSGLSVLSNLVLFECPQIIDNMTFVILNTALSKYVHWQALLISARVCAIQTSDREDKPFSVHDSAVSSSFWLFILSSAGLVKNSFIDILRAILLSLEVLIEDQELQINGFILIIDWSNFSFKQASKLTPSILKLAIEGLQHSEIFQNLQNSRRFGLACLSLVKAKTEGHGLPRPNGVTYETNHQTGSNIKFGLQTTLSLLPYLTESKQSLSTWRLHQVLCPENLMSSSPARRCSRELTLLSLLKHTCTLKPEDSFPARFGGVHFVNQPWYIHALYTLIKPFLKDKTRKRIFLHGNNLNSLHQLIHPECLPSEFGGTLPPYDMGTWARTLLGPDYSDENEYTHTSYNAMHVKHASSNLEREASPKPMKSQKIRQSQCPELKDDDCENDELPAVPELVQNLLLQLDPC